MKLLKIFFTIIAAVTLLILAVFSAGHFGLLDTFRLFVVQSGSMEPTVKLGSVVVVKPQDFYVPDDVISFKTEGDKVVTHRIALRHYPEGVTYQPVYFTQGDANEEIDRAEVKNQNVVGKVALSVPYLGYAVDFAKRPYGFILLVIVPATIIIYEEIRAVGRELSALFKKARKKFKKEAREHSINFLPQKNRQPLPKASILVPAIGAFLIAVAVTGAFLFDKEVSTENTLGAATEFPTPTPTP